MVSMVLLVGGLAAPHAGRVSENGNAWIAPGPLTTTLSRAQPCSEAAVPRARELVFETVQPGELDADEIRELAAGAREVVNFEWHAATGELSYDTSAPTAVFSDLVPSSAPASARNRPICE